MTPGLRRAVLGGVAAVLAAGAASLAAIAALTSPPERRPASTAAAPEVPAAPAAAPEATPAPTSRPAAPPAARSPQPAAARALALAGRSTPIAPPGTPWDAVPTASRPPAALARALEGLRPRLARCYDAEVQAREARSRGTQGGGPVEPGAPVLLLEVEVAADRRARVVGAPVLARGSAEDGLLACAQEALGSLQFGAGALPAGSRLRVRCPLSAVTPALAPMHRAPRVRARPR